MNRKFNLIMLLICFCLIISCNKQEQSYELYVSTQGSDTNPGTKEKPFASLEKAKNIATRIFKSQEKSIDTSIIVYIEPGYYTIDTTLRFTPENSGIDSLNRIIYKATEPGNVFFTGGTNLAPSLIESIDGKPLQEAIKNELQDSIFCINLKKAGITDFGKMKQHGFSIAIKPAQLEVFINDMALYPARWPNDSLMPIIEVIETGSVPRTGDTTRNGGTFKYDFNRASKWKHTRDAWLFGFFAYGYADDNLKVKEIDTVNKQISVVQPHLYGIKSIYEKHWAAEHRKFYVYNIPEEIDRPGEYYFDKQDGLLYFYPPTRDKMTKIQASIMEKPMISFMNASYITLEGITFECSRGMAVYIEKGENIEIRNCVFRNLGTVAVCNGQGVAGEAVPIHNFTGEPASGTIGNIKAHAYDNTTWNRYGGKNHLIADCKIYQTGTGGIILSGGNRLKLIPGNNTVKNCEIFNYNRLNKAYCPAISIDGVGNYVIQCNIHDAPNQGIAIFGNEHLVSECIFERICTEANDMGAIYMGRNPSERGNRIQYCFFNKIGISHHQTVAGIYFDDMACGSIVTNNVFRKAGKGYFSAVIINNGSDTKVNNNLFIDTKCALDVSNNFKTEKKGNFERLTSPGGEYYERLMAVQYKKEPYKSKYPNLQTFFEKNGTIAKRNTFHNNVVVRSKVFVSRSEAKEENFVANTIVLNDSTKNKSETLKQISAWIQENKIDKVFKMAGTNFKTLFNNK